MLLGFTTTESRRGHSYSDGAEHPQLLHSFVRPRLHRGVGTGEPSDKADDPSVSRDLVDRLTAELAIAAGGRKLGK